MSCSSLKHRYDELKAQGISFQQAMELYLDVDSSITDHRAQMEELSTSGGYQDRIDHLQEHIRDGQQMLQELQSMSLQ